MKRWLVLAAALLLSACSQSYIVSDDHDYPYNLPPVGSRVVVKKPITVPAGETRIFLQHGELFRKSKFDRYEESCNLELRKLADTPREIQPDTFIVSKVERVMQEVVSNGPAPDGLMRVGMDDAGDPMVVRGFHLWLGSERQPDVMRMTCRGYFNDLSRAQPPSFNDIKRSLGDYAELILAI